MSITKQLNKISGGNFGRLLVMRSSAPGARTPGLLFFTAPHYLEHSKSLQALPKASVEGLNSNRHNAEYHRMGLSSLLVTVAPLSPGEYRTEERVRIGGMRLSPYPAALSLPGLSFSPENASSPLLGFVSHFRRWQSRCSDDWRVTALISCRDRGSHFPSRYRHQKRAC